jgi:hypothetical protein
VNEESQKEISCGGEGAARWGCVSVGLKEKDVSSFS